MKIAVIADIHANLPALESVLESIDEDIDDIFCAGDIVGYYPFPNDVVELVRENEIKSVKGNHDIAATSEDFEENFNIDARRSVEWTRRTLTEENKEFLKSLPETYNQEIKGRNVYMVHGSPANPISSYIYESDVDSEFLENQFTEIPEVLIMGHTHVPYVKIVDDTLVINPGSVGQPRDGDNRASFAVVDLDTHQTKIGRVDYNVERVVEETQKELPAVLGERLYQGT